MSTPRHGSGSRALTQFVKCAGSPTEPVLITSCTRTEATTASRAAYSITSKTGTIKSAVTPRVQNTAAHVGELLRNSFSYTG